MTGNTFGTIFTLTTFGESHGTALGAVIDGCPSGIELDEADIQTELECRRPGRLKSAATSERKESDRAEILSGVFKGKTTGAPIAIMVRNEDAHSGDYEKLANVFRPGHADYTWQAKYGLRDWRGGGRASGRETLSRVAGGAVAKKLLASLGVVVQSQVLNPPDEAVLRALRKDGDSIGGIVECRADGVPTGWGEPVFDKLDAELAKAVLSIGGIKGIEFGSGFTCATMKGSECNDAITAAGAFSTNNSGGILGGISNGCCIVFRAAVKPAPSIAKKQQTIDSAGHSAEIEICGRHDVFLPPRIAPVIEAMTALVLVDMYLRNLRNRGF